MTIAEKAAAFMERIAADDSHGYDQGSRWGPDYDCSSLVITAYKEAGVPLSCTYTGNMRADMLSHGFRDVTGAVNLATGAGLLRGDVLLHECNHTAMYTGGGQLVHARGNEKGGITGGQPGDQTGGEICKQAYFNYGAGGWDCVLRYEGPEEDGGSSGTPTPTSPNETAPAVYTVRKGDTLWGIAQRFGTTVTELARINGLRNPGLIYPGQVIALRDTPQMPEETVTVTLTLPRSVYDKYGSAEKIQEALT